MALLAFACVPAVAQTPRPTLDELRATRARPLFSPTRRPPLPPAPALNKAVVPLLPLPALNPPIQISGVVVGDDRAIAIARQGSDPHPVVLALGSSLQGWTVVSIRPREVDLRSGSRTVTVRLSAPPSGSPIGINAPLNH